MQFAWFRCFTMRDAQIRLCTEINIIAYVYWNIKNSILNRWKVPVPVRVQQYESSQYRDLVLRGQKVNILIIVIKETNYTCWQPINYRNFNRMTCWITSRMISLETHFDIYGSSIGVCNTQFLIPLCSNRKFQNLSPDTSQNPQTS